MTPTPTLTRVAAPDESDRARDTIEIWLALDPEAQNEQLARLIAAAVHPGPGSALERFAATGCLKAQDALDEINDVRVPLEREGWVDALGRHVLSLGGRS
ncbi:hypothetical protein [Microbacterium proteolyticum]|uniref:hypothetical protein n=1 Tax=Microbacterium proteolyticum TaxID=1572644 RepID=UPI001FAD3888|nr:hypothetical protein [Microbacterium proteolyticum]MCI9857222.1 hypothetical protein [Microbacterium proteolyticum]